MGPQATQAAPNVDPIAISIQSVTVMCRGPDVPGRKAVHCNVRFLYWKRLAEIGRTTEVGIGILVGTGEEPGDRVRNSEAEISSLRHGVCGSMSHLTRGL